VLRCEGGRVRGPRGRNCRPLGEHGPFSVGRGEEKKAARQGSGRRARKPLLSAGEEREKEAADSKTKTSKGGSTRTCWVKEGSPSQEGGGEGKRPVFLEKKGSEEEAAAEAADPALHGGEKKRKKGIAGFDSHGNWSKNGKNLPHVRVCRWKKDCRIPLLQEGKRKGERKKKSFLRRREVR